MGIIRAIGKSIGWNALCIVAGLLQLLFLYLITHYSSRSVDFDKILKDGVILFFCSAVAAGSMIDYLFSKTRYHKVFEWIFLYGTPFVIIIFVVATYCGIIGFQDTSNLNMALLRQATCCCFTATILHSLFFRTLNFLSKEA